MSTLSDADAKTRKAAPVYSGFMAYFPDAIIAVAQLSKIGNDQHNPGQPLHWSKDKSNDHLDCQARHMLDHASGVPMDKDSVLHLTKNAWRALAELQMYFDREKRPASYEIPIEQKLAAREVADAAGATPQHAKALDSRKGPATRRVKTPTSEQCFTGSRGAIRAGGRRLSDAR